MARRLPIYLLFDTSGSMSGEPIVAVQTGLQILVSSLRADPHALETAFLSVITFDTDAKVLAPLTELATFQAPTISAGGTTAMGKALGLVADKAASEVKKSGPDVQGDWKPLVFLFTDGRPTDPAGVMSEGLAKFKSTKWGCVVACGVESADMALLAQLTENCIKLRDCSEATLKSFFKWISSSISSASKSVGSGVEVTKTNQMPPPPPEILSPL